MDGGLIVARCKNSFSENNPSQRDSGWHRERDNGVLHDAPEDAPGSDEVAPGIPPNIRLDRLGGSPSFGRAICRWIPDR
jgi:hypothetical protein